MASCENRRLSPEGRYFDVVDVHVHPEPVPTEVIYGNGTGSMKWVRVDHCRYLDPKRVARGRPPTTSTSTRWFFVFLFLFFEVRLNL